MSLEKQTTESVVEKFGGNAANTGSPAVQIALLTQRLNQLNKHFTGSPKDHQSRRGLLQIVGKRRSLLKYFARTNPNEYKKLIVELGIRR